MSSNAPGTQYDPAQMGANDGTQPPPAKKSGLMKGCLIGCLGIGLISLVVCAGVTYYGYTHAADGIRFLIVKTIEQSEMESEDKKDVIVQVDRVVDGYKSGKITVEQVTAVFDTIGKSPLFSQVYFNVAEKQLVASSGLSKEEKEAAAIVVQRVIRGAFEKKITKSELDTLLDHVTTRSAGEGREMKTGLTDDQVRAYVAACKKMADEKSVPDEPYEVDVGEEVKKIVDEGLGVPVGK